MPRKKNASQQTRRVLEVFLSRPLSWRYGYEIAKETGLKSGTLYPLLIRLDEDGLLEADWRQAKAPGRPQRHVYRLSNKGKAHARALMRSDRRQSTPMAAAKGET